MDRQRSVMVFQRQYTHGVAWMALNIYGHKNQQKNNVIYLTIKCTLCVPKGIVFGDSYLMRCTI